MDFVFIGFAFLCGLLVRMVSLPPLIGFLAAGFVLNGAGFEFQEGIQVIADIGITLMLFSIGLKFNVKDLIKPEVWASGSVSTLIYVLLGVAIAALIPIIGLSQIEGISMQTAAVLAFALSFSSTVCVVKLLEENGETKTRHGKIAIGVLIIQDLFAVLFLVFVSGKVPSLLALALLALPLAAPVLKRLLVYSGHGELLPLTGIFLALGAYELFELLNIKGDLGALVVGMLLSGHGKSSELFKSLMSFKDIFLIGFFLSVGFTALPTSEMLGVSLLICLVLPIKFVVFFSLFSALKLRARTSFLAGISLSNFSEFGLIIAAICIKLGLLEQNWLVILAISVALSFLITNLLYNGIHNFYAKHHQFIRKYERSVRLPEDIYPQPNNAKVIIMGMGRVGTGAYLALQGRLGNTVWGMDADPVRVDKQREQNLQITLGDGEDVDLWSNLDLSHVELVMLALPSVEDMEHITEQLRGAGFKGKIAAIARYDDERQMLLKIGVDKVFNFYTEAGAGFADESIQLLGASA